MTTVNHVYECRELFDFHMINGYTNVVSYFEVRNNYTDEFLVCINHYKHEKIVISYIYDHYPLKTRENFEKVFKKIKETYSEPIVFYLKDNNYFPPSHEKYKDSKNKFIKILQQVGFTRNKEMYFKD